MVLYVFVYYVYMPLLESYRFPLGELHKGPVLLEAYPDDVPAFRAQELIRDLYDNTVILDGREIREGLVHIELVYHNWIRDSRIFTTRAQRHE